MSTSFRPETPEHVAEAVCTAIVEGRALEVLAGGSKRDWGRPAEAEERLDLSRLSGIVAWEPEELVLTALPGTPLPEIEAALAERRQHLAFEPADLGALLKGDGRSLDAAGTLGGAVACNLSGPRRPKVGAARDHVLGFHAVSGRGEAFKAGGRVVKNVTGFDLSKLIAGSFGTLAAITELTVRALPAPEETRTLVLFGLDPAAAVQTMIAASGSAFDVSGAAHLPAPVAGRSEVGSIGGAGTAVTLLRLEGTPPSVAHRLDGIGRSLARCGPTTVLGREESAAVWREIRDVAYFACTPEAQVWRLSVPPTAGAEVVAAILAEQDGEALWDWGGGLVWLALAPTPDSGERVVRSAVAGGRGHATLVRAEAAVRATVPVFEPQPAPLAALSARVKAAFDPARILNPGRMYVDV